MTALPVLSQGRTQVTIGTLAYSGADHAYQRWGPTVAALSEALPEYDFTLLPLNIDGAETALELGRLDFLLTNPGHYRSLMERHRLAPLVSLQTDAPNDLETRSRYGAVIFARADQVGSTGLSEVKGKRFGAVAPEAFGGWQLALHTLVRNGITPEKDLSEIRFFGFPQTAIVEAVLAGEIEAGTVRTGILEEMIATHQISADDIVVLNPVEVPDFEPALSTALVPEWLIAAAPEAPADLRRVVARTLLDEDHSAAERGTFLWQPPQSLAVVIDIQRTLDALEETSGGMTVWQLLVTGFAGFAASGLIWMQLYPRTRVLGRRPQMHQVGQTPPEADAPSAPLTTREKQVLELVEKGMTTKEIARLLTISPKTVEFHRHNLMQKFAASNMADLVHRSGLWRQAEYPISAET